MKIKAVIWIGSSLEQLKKFLNAVKDEIGFALHRAQGKKKSKSGIKTPKRDIEMIKRWFQEAHILAKEKTNE